MTRTALLLSFLFSILLLGCTADDRHLGDGDGDVDADGDVDGDGDGDADGDGDNDADSDADGDGDGDADGDADSDPPLPWSCLDVLRRDGNAPSGVYTISSNLEPEPIEVYCDMETDGGGWTALVNPVGVGLPALHPNLAIETSRDPEDGSCLGEPAVVEAAGWNVLRAYVCGTDSVEFVVELPLGGFEDIALLATVQGMGTSEVIVNGAELEADAEADGCSYWNSDGAYGDPEENECWSTVLDAAPRIELEMLHRRGLELVVGAGPSCSPDCSYGAGLNLTRLMIR